MVTNQIKQLAATRAKVAQLEKSIATQLNRELAGLPGKYGYEDVETFMAAVRAASGGGSRGGRGRKGRGRGAAKAPRAAGKGGGRRKRAVITDDTKNKVKSLVEAGKTGGEIAKAVGISLPSVQNIKKALGLVKARK